jgi:lipopolysaccharide/colanic/teichoic acid biosynthesis glycosyltransferase
MYMHRIEMSPDQEVGQEVLSLNPRVWRDSVTPDDALALALKLPNGAPLCDSPVSAGGNDRQPSPGKEIPHAAGSPLWKRVLDIICILLSLPLWLPIVIFVTLWIKIASPGPVFFRQERVGYRGRRFMIIKFRTMKVNVETQTHERHFQQLMQANCPMTKLDASGDPRIIPGGRILRAMGLDELPQLFNVFRGEMSLVGPRPCTPHEFQCYKPWQQERVNAAPGLTGYWQVNGKNKTTFTEMINMDIFYTKNMSLWLDLAIMLKTFPAIMAQVLESRLWIHLWRGVRKPIAGRC